MNKHELNKEEELYVCPCCKHFKEGDINPEAGYVEEDGSDPKVLFIQCEKCGREVCTFCWEECGHCYQAICHDCEQLEYDATDTLACQSCFVEEQDNI